MTPSITAKERRERRKRAPSIAPATLARLAKQHPTAHCELDHRSPFELLVSVVLSAQTTDVGVNKATPKLFARFPPMPKPSRLQNRRTWNPTSQVSVFFA